MNLIEIPFLKYKKVIFKIWSTIQWEGLDKGIYTSQDMWKYAKYEISKKDSADLRSFEYSAIEKYNDLKKEIKKKFDGKFISIINYDEGNVYIVVHFDDIIVNNEDNKKHEKRGRPKKLDNKKHEKRGRPKKLDNENGNENKNIKLAKKLLESYPFLHEELMHLYNLGLNDRYMSIKIRRKFPEINFGDNKISGWRKINNLRANKTFGLVCKIDKRIENKFLDLYNQGFNDLEIGITVGINPDKIAAWRTRNNLKAHRKRLVKRNK